jgi:alpha-N-arabinofuranosidase
MRRAGDHMNGLSLHYYTVVGDWRKKGAATVFTDDEYFITMKNALHIEELVQRHGAIMERYDPKKRVGMIVDEWGTWFDVEEGTNPGFLYQQNTQRDALVAGLSLNIFNAYCDRVYMANIAQTVNVLQAMLLTDGAKMILTPTYHVFEMWKGHQGATLLPAQLNSETYANGKEEIPAINASASKAGDGSILLTLCHTDPTKSATLSVELRGAELSNVAGRVLATDALNAHNTFDNAESVQPRELSNSEAKLEGNLLTVTLPPASVASISIS